MTAMNNIAIIPARSGSKGLTDKNIKLLNSKPLLVYSIEAAIGSGKFSEVMVSTDSEEYARIARDFGAKVPFLRSEDASSDIASSWDVVEEVLQGYEETGHTFDTFCLLQPTSPLRNSDDIKSAYNLYKKKKAIAVISFTELDHPMEWCGKIDESFSLAGFIPRNSGGQRQKMTKSYRPNGSIYIVSVKDFREDRFLYREGSYAYIMPRERSVDIDTKFDFRFAEFLMNEINDPAQ